MAQNLLGQIRKSFSLAKVQEYTYDLLQYERSSSYPDFDLGTRYCMEALKAAGFQKVERIAHKADGVTTAWDCTMPQAWERTGRSTLRVVKGKVPESARMLADTDWNPIHALIWSAPTPPGGVTCEIVDYETLDPAKPEVKGKWVLYSRVHGSTVDGEDYHRLAEAGAAGLALVDLSTAEEFPEEIFWTNGQGWCGWYHSKEDPRLPVFALTPRRGRRLAEELKEGRIWVHAEMNTRIYDGEIYTVTGVIPGESEEEYALVSHIYEPFAADDTIGFAVGCEFGRQLAARGVKPKKTLRVIFSMELYGLAAYLSVPKHRKNILAACNLDAFAVTSAPEVAFRLSPVFNPCFTDWLLLDTLQRGLPKQEWAIEWGNLSDDTFTGSPCFNIPMNWVHSPCGIYHHNTGAKLQPDWEKTAALIPPLFKAVEEVLVGEIPDYSERAAREFQKRAKELLGDPRLTAFEKRLRVRMEYDRQNGRLDSAERFGAKPAKRAALKAAWKAAQTRLAALPEVDMSAAEYKALNLVVTEKLPGPPFSLSRVPYAERRRDRRIHQVLWALCDGRRSLLECIRIMDAEKDWSENAGAEQPSRTGKAGILKLIDSFRYAEKYGYCRLASAHETTAAQFAKAIRGLGVKKGMNLVVHSTFSSLGRVPEGAEAICRALEDAIGEGGTLVMPTFTFNLYEGKQFGAPFEVEKSPSCTGILSETFRQMPGVLRSYDPCHAYAAWGANARRYVEGHHLVPTVDIKCPLGLLEEDDGWALTISADAAVTFMHVVESSWGAICLGTRTEEYDAVLHGGRKVKLRTWSWRKNTCAKCPEHRTLEIFQLMRRGGTLREARLGNAHLQLFRLADYRKAYETLLAECCNQKSRAYPRTVDVSVKSDWDEKRRRLKRGTTAYTGAYLG